MSSARETFTMQALGFTKFSRARSMMPKVDASSGSWGMIQSLSASNRSNGR
jgi:hypothetical protein